MDPDKYQRAWRAEAAETRVTIDAELLRETVRAEEQSFRSVIFWRDFREVGVALVMIPMCIYTGIVGALPWTWYLGIPAAIWLAGFLLIDRRRHPQTPSEPGEPLLRCVEASLSQVEHQIWLLRNVFWWYLLPFVISCNAFFAQIAWEMRAHGWLEALGFFLFLVVGVGAIYGWVYWINQAAVRKQLEPRRQELLRLRASLCRDSADEDAGDPIDLPTLPFADPQNRMPRVSPVLAIVSVIAAAVLFWLVSVLVSMDPHALTGEGYPKRSPFAAVRWENDTPEVKLGGEWFRLVSIDGTPASEILAYSRAAFPDRWRKRFEEDLVEVLTRMGHPPGDKVTLAVESLASGEVSVREAIPMTYANRRAIRDAAQAREATD